MSAPFPLSTPDALLPLRKIIVRCVLALCLLATPCYGKKFELYAILLDKCPVKLADGANWMMEKGEVFPVLMYKDQQRKIVLQLAGTSFVVDTIHVRILKPKEVAPGLESYRKNVATYLETQASTWKQDVRAKSP